jgi:hypothetical protein
MEINTPLVIMFKGKDSDSVICHLYPTENNYGYREYGLLVCDLVRHVANCFGIGEEEVWDWVDKERSKPTSPVTGSRRKLN